MKIGDRTKRREGRESPLDNWKESEMKKREL